MVKKIEYKRISAGHSMIDGGDPAMRQRLRRNCRGFRGALWFACLSLDSILTRHVTVALVQLADALDLPLVPLVGARRGGEPGLQDFLGYRL